MSTPAERALIAEFRQQLLKQDAAIMAVMPYTLHGDHTLHGDLVCPTGEDLNPRGTTMVPVDLCAIHGTAADLRRYFEYLVEADRDFRIMREIQAEKRRQNTSTCNRLLLRLCIGAVAVTVFAFCIQMM